jgi:hypothetical protein
MNMPVERLEAEALQLPPDERARLARHLIASLDESSLEDPADENVNLHWPHLDHQKWPHPRMGGPPQGAGGP